MVSERITFNLPYMVRVGERRRIFAGFVTNITNSGCGLAQKSGNLLFDLADAFGGIRDRKVPEPVTIDEFDILRALDNLLQLLCTDGTSEPFQAVGGKMPFGAIAGFGKLGRINIRLAIE